ncbi:MAG TPA: hypothetical protein VFY06_10820 [Verrucomicrobiae bacterium]|nr:hypothetical protein [Verrucomicrobiae bacterium]
MTIGPVSDSHREISVTEPVSPALERVKTMLFKPFDLGKWFTIGFCAWLAFLGEGGGGGSFNSGFNNGLNTGNQHHAVESFRHDYQQAQDYVLQNLLWIIPVAAAMVILLLALWVLVLWLSSRGRFMFLHCVAQNRAEVVEPWKRFGREANSLFWFRLVLSLIGSLLMLPVLLIVAIIVLGMALRGEADAPRIILAVGLFVFLLFIAIVFTLIQKFMMDFVVPILFLHGGTCLSAWKKFWELLARHAGTYTLYILFQIVLSMAIGIIVLGAVLITCCIAGCLMAIPYLGTVLLLPVLVFKQSYALYFLRQFGPDYDVFPPEFPAPPQTAPPMQSGIR